jgi:hypothetical protein
MARKQLTEEVTDPGHNHTVDETSAADSLAPNSKGVGDPKSMTSKSAILAKMIGAAHAMQSDELLKHFNSMMDASHNQSRGVPDGNSEHNKSSLSTHPSAASNIKETIQQDVALILDGEEGLSEEFKSKATTLFEAAVEARVNGIIVELEDEYVDALQEQVKEIQTDLVKNLEQYFDYITEQWMKENEVAIESSLRNEMTAEFMNGLRQLFLEHNVNIPEEQVEIVDTMATKIEELETRVNDLINEKSELEQFVSEARKREAIDSVCEGLTLVEAEKLRGLAENVEADDIEAFTKKVEVIKESNFVKGTKTSMVNESLEEVDEDNKEPEPREFSSPQMKSYAAAISRTTRS